MVGRQEEKLQRLYITYLDKLSIAETMRKNLAADIIAGYRLGNVTRQMISIENYEDNVVAAARVEYEMYRKLVAPDLNYVRWENNFLETLRKHNEIFCSI